jgi:hypothetical protein
VTEAQRLWLPYGAAAAAAGAIGVALTLSSDHEPHPELAIGLGLFVGLSFVLAGLIGWTRRLANRTGMLMIGPLK